MKKLVNNYDEFIKMNELKKSFNLEGDEKLLKLDEALEYLSENDLLFDEEHLELLEDYKAYLNEGEVEARFQMQFQQLLDKYGIKQRHDIDNPDIKAKFFDEFQQMSGIRLNEKILDNMFEDDNYLDEQYEIYKNLEE